MLRDRQGEEERDPRLDQEAAAGTTEQRRTLRRDTTTTTSSSAGASAACRPRPAGAAFTEAQEQMWRELR